MGQRHGIQVEKAVFNGVEYTIRTAEFAHSQQVLQSRFLDQTWFIRQENTSIEDLELSDYKVDTAAGTWQLFSRAVLSAFTKEELKANRDLTIGGQMAITPEGKVLHSRFFYDTTGSIRPEQIAIIDQALLDELQFIPSMPNIEEYISLSAGIEINLGEIYDRHYNNETFDRDDVQPLPLDGLGHLIRP